MTAELLLALVNLCADPARPHVVEPCVAQYAKCLRIHRAYCDRETALNRCIESEGKFNRLKLKKDCQ